MVDQSKSTASTTLRQLTELLPFLTEQERAEIQALLRRTKRLWESLPGPQTQAYQTKADILFYGGAAGGAKTDLLIGTALTSHTRSIIFRREYRQLKGIEDRTEEILGSRAGYNSQKARWRLGGGRVLDFGACQYLGDEWDFQGQPRDLIGFDELTHFLEAQFRFLIGWNRTTNINQRCRVICTGNPPTDSDGEWVIRYWGPWLDNAHPHPAKPGELRWFAAIEGRDVEVANGDPFVFKGETIQPKSRTFIPSRVEDNPYLMATGYKSTLQAMPEPLRSMMLRGDFMAGLEDDAWQIIPTEWIIAAQARWQALEDAGVPYGKMTDMGVDVARGGPAQTVLSPRYNERFGKQTAVPGKLTPDGPSVAALVLPKVDDDTVVKVDIIGVGGSAYDFIKAGGVNTVRMNGAKASNRRERKGRLGFFNKRAEWHWNMREALDPDNGQDVAIPPDRELRADLAAPRWKPVAKGIQVEEKEQIIKRIGRSTDKGDSIVYAAASEGETWGQKDIIIQGERVTAQEEWP